ncbi:MAG: ABC transporter substrate-binding protein [Gammaproteobacteria bacterium]|nr:ABC transporter substrate-binding protein [Gammaproteobacteria bacterium]
MKLTRRQLIKVFSAGIVTASMPSFIMGCSHKEPLLRIASNVWPGYELIYLARKLEYFGDDAVRLVELPSATVCIQSLAAGTIEGAMLTLDEVISARSGGIDLRVVAILDISMGADVLMAGPEIKSISDLVGKRIGVEQSAVGAVMLDAILDEGGLKPEDIETKYMTVNRHREAYNAKQVDALITFEPVKTQLIADGAHQLFDSSQIPGRIIDVLAVLPSVIENSPDNLRKLVAAHFQARDYFRNNQIQASEIMSKRLQLDPADVPGSYDGIELPDININYQWMGGANSKLTQSAIVLEEIMKKAKLLSGSTDLVNLIDNRFLPDI